MSEKKGRITGRGASKLVEKIFIHLSTMFTKKEKKKQKKKEITASMVRFFNEALDS